jgi:choline kinase
VQIFTPAVICAAGIGSRLGLNMPKCLVEVEGLSLLGHQLELLREFKEIRIVVGFMEEDVIKETLRYRRDVVFVRNANYINTTNVESVRLATRDLDCGFIAIDGDLWVAPSSFSSFLSQVDGKKGLIGITKSKSEEAVYVDTDSGHTVKGFQISPRTDYEWSGVAYLDSTVFSFDTQGYVYKVIEKQLPLGAAVLECWEVDTPTDLGKLRAYLANKH